MTRVTRAIKNSRQKARQMREDREAIQAAPYAEPTPTAEWLPPLARPALEVADNAETGLARWLSSAHYFDAAEARGEHKDGYPRGD